MAEQQVVNLSCSFCGKNQREVKKLIAGPTVYICDERIGLCNDIIAEEIEPEAGEAPKPYGSSSGACSGTRPARRTNSVPTATAPRRKSRMR